MNDRMLLLVIFVAALFAVFGWAATATACPPSAETANHAALTMPALQMSMTSSSGIATAADYGKCSFNSDCNKGVKCNSGRCADSKGSKCSFNSDCGGKGAKCNSGKCSNAPDGKCNFNSECPGGSCSSGKCKR